MSKSKSLGEQEMDLYRFVSENQPVSVREVSIAFEESKGLARTTVLTMMERLRKKDYLLREKVDGVYKYSLKQEAGEVLASRVADFIDKTLGGSLEPLLNYFSSSSLSEDEIAKLRELTSKFDKPKGRKK